jgi:uncharacterized membrane protein YhaH (DUF805 family)
VPWLPAKREEDIMDFDTLFVNPNGRTARGPFIGALLTILAAIAFYYFLPTGDTGQWAILIMLYPGFVLHVRRLRDMGQIAWLPVVPAALIIAGFWLNRTSPGTSTWSAVALAALIVSAAFVLWGLFGKSKP